MELPQLDYNDSCFRDELFTLLPEQNFDESINSISNHKNIENTICSQHKSKSFSMNSDRSFNALALGNSKNKNNFASFRSIEGCDSDDKNSIASSAYLKENFLIENQSDFTKNIDNQDHDGKNAKVKFKNVIQYKKDVVIKKLLKTIDVMNQELNKRDQLILAIEKENSILAENESKNISKIQNANEQAYYLVEISRQKQEVLNYKNENENLNKKITFLEKQLNDIKKDESNEVSEYKNMTSPPESKKKRDASIENMKKLKEENNELQQLNGILKVELGKLSKQIDLIEKRKTLEKEITDNFDECIRQKEILESENKTLLNKVDVLREEMKICLINFEEDLMDVRKTHEKEILELKSEFEIEESKSIELIKSLREQLDDANLVIEKLDGERTYLVQTLQTTKEESDKTIQDLERRLRMTEKMLENIESEYEKSKKNCESLYSLNLEQQKQIQKLFTDLENKSESSEKLCLKKGDELKRLKQALNLSQEKLKFQQMKFENELEEIKKKYSKDLEQLKFSNDQMTVRNGELSRSNGELRKKLQSFETDLKALNDKYNQIKQSHDFLLKQKKELKEENEKINFTHKKELDVLEKLRDEYLKKNNSQQISIDKMLEQIANFQKEIDALIKRNEDLDSKLKKKSQAHDAYKKKYFEIKSFVKKELFPNNQNIQKQQEEVAKLNQNILNFINGLINDLNLDNTNEELNDSF